MNWFKLTHYLQGTDSKFLVIVLYDNHFSKIDILIHSPVSKKTNSSYDGVYLQ